MKYKAGFIGIGNMGGSLASAVYKMTDRVAVCDMNKDKCNAFVQNHKNAKIVEIDEIATECEFIFLGVKPNGIDKICSLLSDKIIEKTILVSMAAAVEIEKIEAAAKTDKIIRIMPNTPASVGEGMILYCVGNGLNENEEKEFLQISQKCGCLDKLEEQFFDAAMAVSGCGPAFCYMFAKSLADGAEKCGLDSKKANLYAAQTMLGAAKMLLETKEDPEVLKDKVCSPGGTTIEGVISLEKDDFRTITAKAVIAAYEKAQILKNK